MNTQHDKCFKVGPDGRIVTDCPYLEYTRTGERISPHCPLIERRLEQLPDGEYHFKVKDKKIMNCPISLWGVI